MFLEERNCVKPPKARRCRAIQRPPGWSKAECTQYPVRSPGRRGGQGPLSHPAQGATGSVTEELTAGERHVLFFFLIDHSGSVCRICWKEKVEDLLGASCNNLGKFWINRRMMRALFEGVTVTQ